VACDCWDWDGPTNRLRGREASGGHLARNALGGSVGERWVLLGIGGQPEGQNGRTAGARLERDAVGRVTRGRPRRNDEPDRGIGDGIAFGGSLRVEVEGVGRGEVRASSKLSIGEAGGESEMPVVWEADDSLEE